MDKLVLCKFKNKKTGEIIEKFLIKEQYENLSYEFEKKYIQIG